jgi:hypothetical protein
MHVDNVLACIEDATDANQLITKHRKMIDWLV